MKKKTASEEISEISGLLCIEEELLKGIFQRFPNLEKVVLFGSRAMKSNKCYSDIDFCLYGPLQISDLLLLTNRIDDLMLPYKVDLILFNNIHSPSLIKHIENKGKEFFKARLFQEKPTQL